MAFPQDVVLITGANSGIGYEIARQLIADKRKHVLLGARSSEKGNRAVADLHAMRQPGTVEFVQIDVTDLESIKAAAHSVGKIHGKVDCIVNNAGIGGLAPGTPIQEQLRACFDTNCVGTVSVVEAFAPLLKKSTTTPRIINISSETGSIASRLDPSNFMYGVSEIQYRATKAALNMVTADQAVTFGADGWKVFAFCPGFTASNLTPMNNEQSGAKPTPEGARPVVDLINGERDGEHGKFLHASGQHSW